MVPTSDVAPEPPRGTGLYVGDLFSMTKALVHAEFEAFALLRYEAKPEYIDALEDLALQIAYSVELAKWIQNGLRGIDWRERPAA